VDHNFVIDHLHKIIWIIFEASIFRVSVALGWFFWGPIKTYYPLALSPRTCGWSFPQDGLSWSGGRPTPLKNDGLSQLGWWHSQLIWKVIKFMFQTTNQIYNVNYNVIYIYTYNKKNSQMGVLFPIYIYNIYIWKVIKFMFQTTSQLIKSDKAITLVLGRHARHFRWRLCPHGAAPTDP